jgi:hypothetical protein
MANLPVYRPVDCDDMERSIQLCNGIEYLIDDFRRTINTKEPNQLYESEYQSHLIKIADNLEELIHRLTYLADKNNKAFYFQHLFSIIKSLNSAPNVLIVTAYYLDPNHEFKRLLNRNTFDFEMCQIFKKIQFIKPVLQSINKGKKSGVKSIAHIF